MNAIPFRSRILNFVSVHLRNFSENHNSLLRKYAVQDAQCVDADVFDFAAPEKARVSSVRKFFETASTTVGRHTLRK